MGENRFERLLEAYGGDIGALEREIADWKQAQRQDRANELPQGDVVLEARNLSKTYRSGKNSVLAVNDVCFSVCAGEIVALTGPSGSGKSTVLNLLSGLDRPDQGSITIAGTEVTRLNKNKMAAFRCEHIGFVFQFFYLQPFLTLHTNVQVPVMFQRNRMITLHERRERASALVQSVGLADRASHLPRELSGGQMQRAAIARALINKPQLVLADEPTGNLDSQNATSIMELLHEIRTKERTAIVVVTHDRNVAAYADRTIELVDGKVVQ